MTDLERPPHDPLAGGSASASASRPSPRLVPALVVAWLAALLGGCDQPAAGAAASGPENYELCAQCHGADGRGNRAANAPSIAGLPPWYVSAQLQKYRAGHRGTHPDDVGGLQMRPIARALATEADVEAIAQHVAKLPTGPLPATLSGADPARGESLYATCLACHGARAEGNEALKAPPLRGQADWYVATQLIHFRRGLRGTHAEDVSGAMMRPMAAALPDDQATRDLAVFLASRP